VNPKHGYYRPCLFQSHVVTKDSCIIPPAKTQAAYLASQGQMVSLQHAEEIITEQNQNGSLLSTTKTTNL